jgi:2-polyprenyl-3-methyl-5-hydroxy-6-metoxy-1,4-benzoquinol methylase
MTTSRATGSATREQAPRDYVIRGGMAGKRRLELLGRAMWPTTFRLLKRVGVTAGMTCLDIGCGGGDVTLGLARLAGPEGRVVGVDLDDVKLAAAREEAARLGLRNVEFRQANVNEWSEQSVYDRIYARFLLTHLPDCAAALAQMRQALRPGGVLIVEDIDFTGSFCYPPSPAYQRYVELYQLVVRRRKGDPDIGPKLPGLLVQAGLQSVHSSLVQQFHTDQEEKALCHSTLVNIADAVLAEALIEPGELEQIVADLDRFTNDPTTVMGLPRVFQAWGCRPV